jgi:hypothetical protein
MKAHWATIAVFLHVGFGSEVLGLGALYGLILLVVVAAGSGDPAMFVFLVVYVAALLLHRINGVRLAASGRVCHSQYWGTPWLAYIPGLRDERRALVLELLLCLVGGALLLGVSQTLAAYVMVGFLSLGGSLALYWELMRRRVQQLHDAKIEQQSVVDEYHRTNGKW